MLGDLRVIFLTAESAPLAARFRPYINLVNPVVDCTRGEIRIEFSFFVAVGRTHGMRPSGRGGGGKW